MRICAGVIALCVWVFPFSSFADEAENVPKKEKAPRFTLMDSHDEPFAFTFPVKNPVLLTFADQGGHEQMDAWTEPLLEKYGDRIEHRAIAWLEEIPSLMHGAVEKIIQQSYDWVLLDWSGAVAKRYRCKANAANVFLVSKDGFILFEHHGKMTKKRLEAAYAILDEALKEGE